MKYRIILDKDNGDVYPKGFCIQNIEPAKKVSSFFEVVGVTNNQLSCLSSHCTNLAVVNYDQQNNVSSFYIVDLMNGGSSLLKKHPCLCIMIEFHPDDENIIYFSDHASFYTINICTGTITEMLGHKYPVIGIDLHRNMSLVMSYSVGEVLLWAQLGGNLHSRMKVNPDSNIAWAGVCAERQELIIGFECGTVIIWEDDNHTNQIVIKAPRGVNMKFKCYAFIRNTCWLVGGGNKQLLVTYSLETRRVAQVVQLPSSCPDVQSLTFIPPVSPQYSQTLLVRCSEGSLNVIDHASSTKIKTLTSHQYHIDSASISKDGFLLAITYSNAVTKLYTLRSFFPQLPKRAQQFNDQDIEFNIIKEPPIEKIQEKRKCDAIEVKAILDRRKWYPILRDFGEYPSKYRVALWSSVLQLPRNYAIVTTLLKRDIHQHFKDLNPSIMYEKPAFFKELQKILSCLAHWAPFLCHIDYLPYFVLPFVKMLHSNLVVCFEVISTVILNWCCFWFEFWPHPSTTILNLIKDLLNQHCPDILTHFDKLQLTLEECVWPVITNLFQGILSSNNWLILWDHILSNPPTWFITSVVAYLTCSRATIQSCDLASEIHIYLSQETWVSVKSLIAATYKIHEKLNLKIPPWDKISSFKALPVNGLPLFNIAPQDICDQEIPQIVNSKIKSNLNRRVTFEDIMESRHISDDLRNKADKCIATAFNLRKRHLVL